jgi:uncharacterized protein
VAGAFGCFLSKYEHGIHPAPLRRREATLKALAGSLAVFFMIPVIAAAQSAPQFDAQHSMNWQVPLSMLGKLGEVTQALESMKPEQFDVATQNAEKGDAQSQAVLCLAYRLGDSVQQDESQAIDWCQKAANQHNAIGLEELAMIYTNGSTESSQPSKAIPLLTEAAGLGSASAMDNLGTFYANGIGVPQDYAQAVRWYTQSSTAGFPPADYDLAIAYFLGQSVPKDSRQAMVLFSKAANSGLPIAMFMVGSFYEEGLPPIKADQKTALQWFQKGADLGESRCEGELGWAYANGVGTKRDYAESVRWYKAAAEQGDPVGAYGLGVRYLTGQGVERDISQAMFWFQKAAEGGHADAAFNLGALYANQIPGRTEPPDFVSAAKYLTIAANQDISDGQCMLGLLYAQGYGVPQDDVTGYAWILLSLRGSHACVTDEVNLRARMSPEQVAEAQKRAAAFKPLASEISYGKYAPAKPTQ